MATHLECIIIDGINPTALAAFWATALGRSVGFDSPDEVILIDPDQLAPPLVIVGGAQPKVGKNPLDPSQRELPACAGPLPVHLDLASTSVEHRDAQVARLLAAGARHVDVGQGEASFVVLGDPEGNEFCVLGPRPEYAGSGAMAAIVFECGDLPTAGPFWAAATGWQVARETPDMLALRRSDGRGPILELFDSAPPVATGFRNEPLAGTAQIKTRVHLDIEPESGGDQLAELARLEALGASRADIGQGATTWVVLSDPVGHVFCLLRPGTLGFLDT